jgi:hypothetical protein
MANFVRGVAILLIVLSSMRGAGRSLSGENRGRVLSVGPGKPLAIPSQAAAVVRDGDTVEIDAGTYTADVAVWRANNLTLRGTGGRPHLKAGGANAQGKAIWVIQGDNTVVENIEFSGEKVPDGNGAAIRQEGRRLTLRDCYIHDNEMGILAGNKDSDVLIEASEFSGSTGPYNHNIYMGNIRSFTLRYSYVHDAMEGHNVKTRASTNFILYNRIMDESTGRSSYAIDIPNGGRSYIIGNVIQKGPKAENSSVIAYAAEGAANEIQELYLVNNTIVSSLGRGRFLNVFGTPRTFVINNIFSGQGVTAPSFATATPNLVAADPFFEDPVRFDYHLKRGSPAIDAGIDPGTAAGFDLNPQYQYMHPLSHRARVPVGAMDLGAFEYADQK